MTISRKQLIIAVFTGQFNFYLNKQVQQKINNAFNPLHEQHSQVPMQGQLYTVKLFICILVGKQIYPTYLSLQKSIPHRISQTITILANFYICTTLTCLAYNSHIHQNHIQFQNNTQNTHRKDTKKHRNMDWLKMRLIVQEIMCCGHNSYIFNKVMMLQYSEKVIGQARKTRGYLQKRSSGLLAIWQKRYFIIYENSLSYYADETLQEVKRSLPIEEIKNIKLVGTRQFQLVTKKRIYELKAEDQATRDLWVASLNLLVNYKEWSQTISEKVIPQSRKEATSKRYSKNKKISSRTSSPPQLSKQTSAHSTKRSSLESEFSAESFFNFICLPRLAELWEKQSIRSKALILKQSKGCYFIVSCKTLLYSHEDEELLNEQLIHPYDFNSLYYFEFGKIENPQVVQICKCFEFINVEAEPGFLKIQLQNKTIQIKVEQRRMEVIDMQSIIKKLKSCAFIGRQYHNPQGIKIKRNIDQIVYKYDTHQLKIKQIVDKQFEKSFQEGKDVNVRNQFRKNLENLRKNITQISNACEVKDFKCDFKQAFMKQYEERVYQYVQKTWGGINKKALASFQIKKIVTVLYEIWKFCKDGSKEDRLYHASLSILKILIEKYEEQILTKVDSCFLLTEQQLLDQINIQIHSEDHNVSKSDTIFLSNSAFRQFHVDIRLTLYQFSQMPIAEKTLQLYLNLYTTSFKHIAELTFKYLQKWRNIKLILGTCNEIEFIKTSLFEQMCQRLTKDYKHLQSKVKRQQIKQLEGQINNIQIMLVKKLFVLTFSDLDRNLLNKSYDALNIEMICSQILSKLKEFIKINRYVKRNIYEASFEQICYFYYTSIIKFNRKKKEQQTGIQFSSDFFNKKITEDIKVIGQIFQGEINSDKIYTHLKDLSLIKQFLQCDLGQIKKYCLTLKKQFGNSFTEGALKNLLSLRELTSHLRQDLFNECSQIVKNSADTPDQISIISSSRESFLQNWNNTRSRKSTLTLSLNQFYQNQYTIHNSKENCAKSKAGYLSKKRCLKDVQTYQTRLFYRVKCGQLIEYEKQGFQQESICNYNLQTIKKCYIHPQKSYIFYLQFPDLKFQLKAETSDEAKEWIKNIYQQVSLLAIVKDHKDNQSERDSNILYPLSFLPKQSKQLSTMESYNRQLKDKSLQKSIEGSPKLIKKTKKEQSRNASNSPEKGNKLTQKQKNMGEDNCIRCSKGFFF